MPYSYRPILSSFALLRLFLFPHFPLQIPTSLTWDDQGWVLVSEKQGLVKGMQGWVGTPNQIVLDIQDQVANYGDHGEGGRKGRENVSEGGSQSSQRGGERLPEEPAD